MLVKNPKFEISAVSPKQYPTNDLPQIVLVGKSNYPQSCGYFRMHFKKQNYFFYIKVAFKKRVTQWLGRTWKLDMCS